MLDFDISILIKGAGDLATGVAHRLHRAGFRPVLTELAQPLTVRRGVSFSEAVYEGRIDVEGVTAARAQDLAEAKGMLARGLVPVLVDPAGDTLPKLSPTVLIEATLAKRNTGVSRADARWVIGLGPGFTAGQDVHAVVETQRGHDLGRVILDGAAQPNTGEPEAVRGYTHERVLRAPGAGIFTPALTIGDPVAAGQVVGHVGAEPVPAAISGVVRGLLHGGLAVSRGLKIGDVDPRGRRENCFTMSDKALAVGGAVLEALLHFMAGRE
ncbi:MAG TPA: selenium-dependent molybdenum cofactor biosynthesis protein YqeB [Spirochaetia bacterium]|nr:selenium-dependent molybdenum cofactor biosynthesis protein YqeB [Spirochaetia bacterium]